jgi:hypothetical protein
MKLFVTILTIFGVLFSRISSVEIGLTGHLLDFPKNLHYCVAVFGDGKYLNSSKIYEKGDFTLDFSDSREKTFDFYYCPTKGDTLLIASLKAFGSDEPNISFYRPRLLTSNSKISCPACHLKDHAYKLSYSTKDLKEFTPTSIKYYCTRDKMKF